MLVDEAATTRSAAEAMMSGAQSDGRSHARAVVRVLGVALLSLITACASTGAIPSLYDTQARIASYISSGQYDKEFAAVVARAQAYMEKRAGAVSKPAIVLDIDETSLSNWPAYRMNRWSRITTGPCDLDHGPCGIRAWQAMATSKALAPTLELARRAEALGGRSGERPSRWVRGEDVQAAQPRLLSAMMQS